MTTPLIPINNNFIRSSPTVTYIGRTATGGDGFPAGTLTFGAGTKIIVLCVELAGSPASSGVTVGGVALTQACNTGVLNFRSAAVWYLQTSASGALAISGTGGSGRSALDAYEIRGYTSAVPYNALTSATTVNATTSTITIPTATNSAVLGAGVHGFTNPTISANQGPAPTVVSAAYESATGHFSWNQINTYRDETIYTVVGSVVSGIDLAVAAWR